MQTPTKQINTKQETTMITIKIAGFIPESFTGEYSHIPFFNT